MASISCAGLLRLVDRTVSVEPRLVTRVLVAPAGRLRPPRQARGSERGDTAWSNDLLGGSHRPGVVDSERRACALCDQLNLALTREQISSFRIRRRRRT